MVKKRGASFPVSNRVLYTFITVAIIAILSFGVYALTGGVAPNPGHLITDIAPPSGCQNNQLLEFSGGTWICITPAAGTTDTRCDTSGTCSQVCIGSDCRNAWPSGGGGSNFWTSVPAAGGITALGQNLILDAGKNISSYTYIPPTSYTNYGICNPDTTQDALRCADQETESNVVTLTCTQNSDNFTYVSQRTCTGSGSYQYLNKISFPQDSSKVMISGQIVGSSSGSSPYLHGYVSGPVGALSGQNHVVGTLPAGYTGSRCLVFLSGFTEEHCSSGGSCTPTRIADASCYLSSNNQVYGSLSGDGVGVSDGYVTCGYLCW